MDMARSADAYGGAFSRTRTESLHYRCPCGALFATDVHRVVNATRDPDLTAAFLAGTLARATCPTCAQRSDVQVPVVYHDETERRFVLVLPPALRHRELEERAELLVALARDAGHNLPSYVVEFTVVFGAAALAAPVEEVPLESAAVTAPLPGEGEVQAVIEDSTNRMALAVDRSRLPDKDEAVERWALSRTPAAYAVSADGEVRLLLKVGERLPTGPLDVRLLLHRLPSYPLAAITVGVAEGDEPHAVFFDVDRPEDRQALTVLAQDFRLVLDFYDEEYEPVMRREIVVPLASNARYVLAVADEQLAQLPEGRRSFEAAIAAFRAPGFDRFGRRDPRLDEGSFVSLPMPAAVQQALGVVAGWSEPSNEDHLLLVRSFPLDWWRAIRGRVVERAVEHGLVLSGPLMDVALVESQGSRRELVARLLAAFADLCSLPETNDLGPDQIAANWRALFILCDEEGLPVDAHIAEVARQTPGVRPFYQGESASLRPPLGEALVVVQPRRLLSDESAVPTLNELVAAAQSSRLVRPATPTGRAPYEETGRVLVDDDASADEPAGRSPPLRPDFASANLTDLLDLLDDKDLRLGAALELVRRADALAVGPVFGAIRRMTRSEAVRVLPAVIQFGEHALPHLVDGLRSRKAYLRQGCALALGVMKSADGIDALCDLLVGEPTEVWKEVARGLGEIGSAAVMPLLARLRDPQAQDPDVLERIAWALAHIAAKGGRGAVETAAGGRDVGAAETARRALELAAAARENDAQVHGRLAGDVTVNRAFSKKFFEAMDGPPRFEPATPGSGSVIMEGSVDESLDHLRDPDAPDVLEPVVEEMIEEDDILPN